jgi:cysteine desulfurase family protein
MKRIYLDNAATSFPKPDSVHQAMMTYATNIGASSGRGAYFEAMESSRIIRTCRERIASLIGAKNPDHIIMTMNCSDGLNAVMYGLLNPGDHVITTWMDHNSILRPLNALAERIGVSVDFVRTASDGIVDPSEIKKAIRPNTKLIAALHASNVTGTVQPIHQIGKIAKENNIYFLCDAAQTVGHLPIDVTRDDIDFLAAPGHKGLLGPLGTGFFYIKPGLDKILKSTRQGGTGSRSEEAVQPELMPDKFETGSHNAIGIAALSEGVAYLLEKNVETLRKHDQHLCRIFMAGLDSIEGLTWFGPRDAEHRVGVFSVRMNSLAPQELSDILEKKFGILTRSGLHCAPLAHKTIGTLDVGGTTRFSFGSFTTQEDIQYVLESLSAISKDSIHQFSSAR